MPKSSSAPIAPEFLALQQRLKGRYSLVRELGRGGMGIVYLAHEVALDRPVALKVLPPALAHRTDLRERFLREARTAAKLSHPNIVPIFAVDEVDEFVFFAMAYVHGETLGARIKRKGPLPPSEAIRILREVSWALAYAHAQGVVHRDVKPDNVILEEPSGRALVMDFGIAHVRSQEGVTAPGEIIGTVEFMSPEQAAGEPVDPRSDLYALGVVGYLTLSGTLPFEAPTVQALLMKQITQPAPPLADHPGIPSKLCQAIDRCLQKDPDARFQSGEAFADALGAAVERQAEVPVPLRVFERRLRRVGAISMISGFYLLAGCAAGASALAGAGRPIAAALVIAGGVLGVAAIPTLQLAGRARPLIRLGYDADDVATAVTQEAVRRREELRFEHAQKSSTDTRLKLITVGLLGTSLVLFLASGGHVHVDGGIPLGVATLAAGMVTGGRLWSRRNVRLGAPSTWERFWKGRFGRWVFRLAGIGLKRPAISAAGRPTELVIGGAVEQLFAALPKDTRRALGDLPAVVRDLEDDARKMRARINALNTSLASVRTYEHHDAMQTGAGAHAANAAGKRDALADDLKRAITTAEERLHEAVAALETIRLELLRMQGGVGSVESLTADLGAAKELSDAIARLLDGQREVEALLQPPTASAESS